MTPGTREAPGDDGELTLHEAAERAGVHYMTVYRWVRTSRLRATKRGGRWVVAAADLARVADGVTGEPGSAPSSRRQTTPGRPAVDRLRECLIKGDGAGAMQVVEEALAGGMDPEDVHLDLLAGAMRQVGDEWAAGRITIADEHRATAAAHSLIGGLARHFHRPGRRKGTIVIGAPPGDRHALPLALLGDPARGRGYDVIDLGADVPPEAFAEAAAAADRLVAVGIHASIPADQAVARTVAALRDRIGETPILIGGTGVVDADHAHRLGGDRYGHSSRAALDHLT